MSEEIEAIDISSLKNINVITQAPVESFKSRELYAKWKQDRLNTMSYFMTPSKNSPSLDASDIKAIQKSQYADLEDSISSAYFYKYFCSIFSSGSLLGAVYSAVQSRRNKWLFLATPAFCMSAYMNFVKYEEAMDDIQYLNRRKELRESVEN